MIHFLFWFNIKEAIDKTLKGDFSVIKPNTKGRDGFIFEQTFSNPIGKNKKGKPLYTLKIVISSVGKIITAFPKK